MARPKNPILNQRVIIDSALELSRVNGDFTMSELAAQLGVSSSSLYNHVPSKGRVINLLRSGWLGVVVDRVADLPLGPERLRALMIGYYEQVRAMPGLIPRLFREPIVEDESFRFYDEVVACARQMGATREEATGMIALVDGFVLGSALDTLAPPFDLSDEDRAAHPDLDWGLDQGSSTSRRGLEDFVLGVDVVVAGAAARFSGENG